jgi:hypothetical protein
MWRMDVNEASDMTFMKVVQEREGIRVIITRSSILYAFIRLSVYLLALGQMEIYIFISTEIGVL